MWLILLLALTLNPNSGLTQDRPRHTGKVPVEVTATAYCQRANPTASGRKVFVGCIALSRDLERQLNAKFGDVIILNGRRYIFADRMHHKWRKRVDVYRKTKKECDVFGKRRGVLLTIVYNR